MDYDNVYYKQKLLQSHEWSEIDFDFQDFIGFDYEKHDDHVNLSEDIGEVEGYPIEIDKILSKLQQMKEEGATHVSLDYHVDHIGYIIDAWEISKASRGDIQKFCDKLEIGRKKAIEKEKERLKRKLKTLEGKT